jgi:hypothetical protein
MVPPPQPLPRCGGRGAQRDGEARGGRGAQSSSDAIQTRGVGCIAARRSSRCRIPILAITRTTGRYALPVPLSRQGFRAHGAEDWPLPPSCQVTAHRAAVYRGLAAAAAPLSRRSGGGVGVGAPSSHTAGSTNPPAQHRPSPAAAARGSQTTPTQHRPSPAAAGEGSGEGEPCTHRRSRHSAHASCASR